MTALDTNIRKLDGYLARLRDSGIANRIGGRDRSGAGGSFETLSPVDKSPICQVARGTAADIDAAARAAADTFPAWRDMAASERRAILLNVARAIEHRAEEIALCECWDTGQTIRFMSKAALRGAENFRFFAEKSLSSRDGCHLPSPTLMNITTRVPIGPVGVITPWNTPFMLSTWKIAPALAAGCTVVHKPAEASPLTARLLVEIAEEAGLPPGVLNTVNGFGDEAGRALTEHPLIRAIAFVGESRTGSMITRQGADTLKRMHLELGGKNPVIVFDDADLDRALDAVIFMIFSINGERCTSSSRLLVQDTIRAEFESRLVERINRIKVGHPLDPQTEIGPLVTQEHYDKVRSYFDIAVDDGATIAAGGVTVGDTGYFLRPTLVTGATNTMRTAREEIFGPVLSVLSFRTPAEAIAKANNTPYGLSAGIWSDKGSRILAVADKLRAGVIWANTFNRFDPASPFGGYKESGYGREGGRQGLAAYLDAAGSAPRHDYAAAARALAAGPADAPTTETSAAPRQPAAKAAGRKNTGGKK
ncbi:MAG: 5-carboxymethyl-2-hydroxymuconate semialdehyde dehydrogenase [Microthrixaceae bacterium]|nr:5-carboxymethyl-2-hydroxymuconate semialdehyde dehydrogenase [Microthrixaceae bacterium]